MEEKVLLKSKQSHVLHICIIVFTLFMIIALGVTFTSEEYKSYAEAKQIRNIRFHSRSLAVVAF